MSFVDAAPAVTYPALERALSVLGFVALPSVGAHLAFRHSDSDTLIVLPAPGPGQMVREVHLTAVWRTLLEKEVTDAETLKGLLAPAAPSDAVYATARGAALQTADQTPDK